MAVVVVNKQQKSSNVTCQDGSQEHDTHDCHPVRVPEGRRVLEAGHHRDAPQHQHEVDLHMQQQVCERRSKSGTLLQTFTTCNLSLQCLHTATQPGRWS